MSKKSKKTRSAKRAAEKRSQKAAKKALYENYAKLGKARKKGQGASGKLFKGAHLVSDCGNPGCKKCNATQNTGLYHGAHLDKLLYIVKG